jgi:indolepyruvate decarboxylase
MTEDDISRRRLMQLSASSVVAQRVLAGAAIAATAATTAEAAATTVEGYILTRLAQNGCGKLFGVAGATCSPIFDAAGGASGVSLSVTSSDLGAGYAADGYARVRGLGAVAVTYGVGTMSLLTAIAGAYAERSAVVVINGGPTGEDLRLQRDYGTLYSHSTGKTGSDMVMFREITAYAGRIERASDAPRIIDEAITAAKMKQRPVYIEVAKSAWRQSCPATAGPLNVLPPASGTEDQIAGEIADMLRGATKPAVLVGIEVQRYGLAEQTEALIKRLGLPWSSTLLAKAVVSEQTPGFAGVYGGENSSQQVIRTIEGADALLTLGCVFGRQYRRLAVNSRGKMASVYDGSVRLKSAAAKPASLPALVAALAKKPWTANPAWIAAAKLPGLSFDERRIGLAPSVLRAETGLTYDEVMRTVSGALDDRLMVITDTSLSMYPGSDINVIGRGGFMCDAVWQAIGFSVGAAVGVAVAGGRRPIAICGDGGFQMTAQCLSSFAREKTNAIAIVLDNGLQGIEQWILGRGYFANTTTKPKPYLEVDRWDYVGLARSLGVSFARAVATPDEFRQALADAKANTGPSFIVAAIKPHDLPAGLPSA